MSADRREAPSSRAAFAGVFYTLTVRVAVIGAGAAGLVSARELVAAGHRPTVFEASPLIGGVWAYSEEHGPMYESLRTNLPTDVMAFPGVPLPPGVPRFPGHREVLAYLEAFTDRLDLRPRIRLSTRVHQVEPTGPGWSVDEEPFDAVVIANGHYNVPHHPRLPGRDKTHIAVSHSLEYRRPHGFRDQRVVLVGAKASGLDLALEIGTVAQTVFSCAREHQGSSRIDAPGDVRREPTVVAFDGDRAVRLADGRRLESIDALVLCTGYRYAFEFLASGVVEIEDNWVHPLHLDIFAARNPTLAFVGLPFQVVPFPLFEAQARLLAKVWAGEVSLPSSEAMTEAVHAEAATRLEAGTLRRHLLRYGDRQFERHAELVAHFGGEPLPPRIEREYRRTRAHKIEHPRDYRDRLGSFPEDAR